MGEKTTSNDSQKIDISKIKPSGFVNEKGQNINSGIVELTKIIGDNRTV